MKQEIHTLGISMSGSDNWVSLASKEREEMLYLSDDKIDAAFGRCA